MHAIDGMACAKRGCDNRGKLSLNIVGHGSFPTKWGRRWRYRCTVCGGTVSTHTGTAYSGLRCARRAFDVGVSERLFGSACVYGQVLKTRRNDRVVRVERRRRIGTAGRLKAALWESEDSETLNTSFVERLNLTIRQGSAYLRRRSPCQFDIPHGPLPGSHLVAHGRALWKLTAPWTHRTRPPCLGKRCAFSTSSHRAFPIKSPTKNPERPQNGVGKPG